MKPLISLIIPISPRENIDIFLRNLKKTKYPNKLEIIFAEGKNPSKQRNEAIKKSRGDIIYFLDSDSYPQKDIFQFLLKDFKKNIDGVGGPAINPESSSLIQKTFHSVLSSFLGSGMMRYRYKPKKGEGKENDFILCNFGLRKNVAKKFMLEGKLFNENLHPNEENELFSRLFEAKRKIIYDPNLIVFHEPRKTLLGFSKQIFNYGRGRMRHFIIRPKSFNPYFFMPTAFLLYLILTPFLYNFFGFVSILPLISYIILVLYYAFLFSFKNFNPLYIFSVPLSYFILHISYGMGLLYGIFSERKLSQEPIKVKKICMKK